MKREQLTKMIDEVYDAVAASKMGPIFPDLEHKNYSMLSYNLFLALATKLAPQAMEILEPKEPWQSGPEPIE